MKSNHKILPKLDPMLIFYYLFGVNSKEWED
jgi:hypothetical protein